MLYLRRWFSTLVLLVFVMVQYTLPQEAERTQLRVMEANRSNSSYDARGAGVATLVYFTRAKRLLKFPATGDMSYTRSAVHHMN